ncbi:hypothetical protein FK220_017735 [Flavobacteriaceae bacterium TP-CH-4]|uniref:Uncharacterized protein n=1 Tax=Pelagihabitans pacificus TaxID=2696054 RepID=A0A967AVL0_9FLAO|nr:hypothetical protein [Pelagihabitans pacificus]NHF61199.1 hypothetical protein [Pelagihabitans pacificus]
MLKFFRKIRAALIKQRKFRTYLAYAVGEIVLVVIGILIALSINNLKDAADLIKEGQHLYKDIITELREDLKDIQENADYNNYFLERYRLGRRIILTDKEKEKSDSLAVIASELTKFSDFKNDRPIYDRLFTSGEQDLINDPEILGDLKRLAVLYNYINRLEKNQQDFMYIVLPKIADYIRINPPEIKDLDALYGYRFHNDIEIFIIIMEEKEQLYQDAADQLNELLADLNAKLE